MAPFGRFHANGRAVFNHPILILIALLSASGWALIRNGPGFHPDR